MNEIAYWWNAPFSDLFEWWLPLWLALGWEFQLSSERTLAIHYWSSGLMSQHGLMLTKLDLQEQWHFSHYAETFVANAGYCFHMVLVWCVHTRGLSSDRISELSQDLSSLDFTCPISFETTCKSRVFKTQAWVLYLPKQFNLGFPFAKSVMKPEIYRV